MQLTATRINSEDTIIATMSFDVSSDIEFPYQFFERLKKSITEWAKTTEEGKKAYNYSSGDFNFGDLASYLEDSKLVEILKSNGITNLKMSIINSKIGDFSFDAILVEKED